MEREVETGTEVRIGSGLGTEQRVQGERKSDYEGGGAREKIGLGMDYKVERKGWVGMMLGDLIRGNLEQH